MRLKSVVDIIQKLEQKACLPSKVHWLSCKVLDETHGNWREVVWPIRGLGY